MIKATCQECKQVFQYEILRRKIDEDKEELYLKCPSCNAEFHILYQNQEIRDTNKKLQEIQKLLLDDKKNTKLFKATQRLMRKHKKLMDEYNGRM